MKNSILLVVLFAFTAFNCSKQITQSKSVATTQKQQQQLPEIIYEETSRGFSQKITVKEGILYSIKRKLRANEIAETKQLSNEQLQVLAQLINKLDFDEMKNYKAPSEKRFYDGAPTASLIIIKNNNTYTSTSFDGGNPPIELKEIIENITTMATK